MTWKVDCIALTHAWKPARLWLVLSFCDAREWCMGRVRYYFIRSDDFVITSNRASDLQIRKRREWSESAEPHETLDSVDSRCWPRNNARQAMCIRTSVLVIFVHKNPLKHNHAALMHSNLWMLRINLRVFYAMLGDLFLKQVKVCFSALDVMINVCIDVEYLVQLRIICRNVRVS